MKRTVASTIACLHALLPVVPLGASAATSGAAWLAGVGVPLGAALTLAPDTAMASPAKLAAARQQYAVGDIPSAARALQGLVGPSGGLRGAQLEDARKLFGICQFLLGNKSQAEAAFASVLKANPNAKLNKKDVIDPAISDLYDRVRARVVPRGAAAAAAPAPRGGRGGTSPPSAPRGFTGVHVKTNAENATVFAGGIFVGTSNQDIALDPGEQRLTISATGFEDVTRAFLIKRNERLTLTVTLLKAGERERRAAALAAGKKAKAAQAEKARKAAEAAERKKKEDTVDYTTDLPAGAKKGRAQQSLADEFFRDQQAPLQPPPAPVYQQNPYAAQQPATAYPAPAPAYGFYQQPAAPPVYGQQPVGKKKSYFLAFMPLGVGQFQNGDTFLGLTVAAVQLGGLGTWFFAWWDLQQYNKSRGPVCNREVPTRSGDGTPVGGVECIKESEYDGYVAQATLVQNVGMGLFALGWIGGVAEAMWSFDSKPAGAAPGLGAPPPGYYGLRDATPVDDGGLRTTLQPVANPLNRSFGLKLEARF